MTTPPTPLYDELVDDDVELDGAWDDDLTHLVCDCDDTVALCGATDMEGPTQARDAVVGPECPFCHLLDERACPRCGL